MKQFLESIRAWDVSAAGVLADLLEETGDVRAVGVRHIWNQWLRRIRFYDQRDWTRKRNWTRWQACVWATRQLRRRINRLFRQRWREDHSLEEARMIYARIEPTLKCVCEPTPQEP